MPLADPALVSAPSRLAALDASGLLDSPPEESFDRLTRVASRVLKAPVALVSLVTGDRQFFKSQTGLADPWASARETPLSHSFCQHVVATGRPLVIEHARHHPLVADNLAIPDLGVIAYAGLPLTTAKGETLGSFCAIDTEPRVWTPEELDFLDVLAQAAMREVELRVALADLRRVSAFKDEMIGVASHEMRTPLNGIMGALQFIEMEMAPGVDRRMLDIALMSSRRLLRLLNDLLNVEQLENGAIAVRPVPHPIGALVRVAVETVRATTPAATITVEPAAAELRVMADADLVVQVLVNLFGNALKFAPAGSPIDVAAAGDGAFVRVVVRDRGRGVPDEMKQRVFERFVQVESADKHELGGAGLGLAICRSIVAEHKGTIWVEDVPDGTGSRFIFTLPAA